MISREVFWNSVANLGGVILYPLLSLVLVPFYIRYLGLDGYGLVGFFSVVLSLLGIFTKGIGTAVQKEVAVRSAPGQGEMASTVPTLVRTYEILYWILGSALAAILAFASSYMAGHWVHSATLSRDSIQICLILISVRIALTLPLAVYQAALYGAERQVRANAIIAASAALGAVLSVTVVYSTRSVVGFYASDLAVSFLANLVCRWHAYRVIRGIAPAGQARFDPDEVRSTWRFSAGMLWSHGVGLLMTQTDRLVISRMLPLSSLGIFSVASSGGRVLGMVSVPYLNAVFPRNCQLAREENRDRFTSDLLVHARIVTAVVLTIGVPIAFFSSGILRVWTHNETIVRNGANVMTIYVLANIALAFASVLYQSQLAMGAPRFAGYYNTAAAVWLPPVAWWLTRSNGLGGAASSWLIFCIGSWIWNCAVLFGHLLRSSAAFARYLQEMIVLVVPAVVVGFAARVLAVNRLPESPVADVVLAGAAAGIIFAISYVQFFGLRRPQFSGRDLEGFPEPPLHDND